MGKNNIRLLQALLIALWPVVTWASGESLGQTMGSIKAADWIAVVVLSGGSGVVSLLHRIRKSYEAMGLEKAGHPFDPGSKLMIDLRFFAVCQLAGSFFVGFIAFLICEFQDLNGHMEALLIVASAWGGATLADKWADAAGEKLTRIIGKD